MRILFSGMIAGVPGQGGAAWAILQYLLGFQQLGHEVCFVEPLASVAIRPEGSLLNASMNAAYFREVMLEFGLERRSALLGEHHKTVGLAYDDICEFARSADLLINVSGMLADENLTGPVGVRVYLDLDPVFNQLWSVVEHIDMHFTGHTHFVTVGQAVGRAGCPIPDCGLEWIPTWQPVVLRHWPVGDRITRDALTTVGNWRGYGSIEHEGIFFGQKAHSLRPLMSLPTLTNERFEIAISIHPGEVKDLAELRRNGWTLLDPARVAHTPSAYREFITTSKAEFGIAKSGYVVARSGWFSDRSVCYLAAGRPVIAQDTGFSDLLPTGCGLFGFTTIDDVLEAIASLKQDYGRHSQAARHLAEEFFDSDKVLSQFLQRIGVTA